MILSEKQLNSIREADCRINVWHGAVRSGKSFASLWAFFHFMRFGPPGACVIVGRTTHTIIRNIIDPMKEFLGDSIKYLMGRQELSFFGRKVYIIPASDSRAEGRVRGSTFVGAYVDEGTLIPENFFQMLLSRLSLEGARLFLTTNPDSPLHWLKREFLDRYKELDLKDWHFTLEDNPSLSDEFVKQIKTEYTGLWYQRLIEGKWVQAEGAIYDFFDQKKHCIDFPLSHATYYVAGVDYGTHNAFACVLLGVNFQHYPNIWVEGEYYFDSKRSMFQKTDADYADDLRKFFRGRYLKGVYVDPAAASFKLELMRAGVENVFDAKNDVISGIQLVRTYLEKGTLKICSCAKNLIKEIQGYVWDPKSQQLGVDRPLKQSDHACVSGDTKIVIQHVGSAKELEIKWLSENLNYGELYNYNKKTGRVEIDEFQNVLCTREKSDIYELELEDGKNLRATPDHKIMTQRGLIELQHLTLSDIVFTCNISSTLEKNST